MLGLGLMNNKSVMKKSMPLDVYKNNLVMGFSYYKLLSSYSGYCARIRRSNDNAERDFGFVNNYIDYSSIVSWVGAGNSGYITTWYNQYVSGNNALQPSTGNQPRIVNNGVFDFNGLYFDGVDYNFRINNYAQLSITDNPLAIYINIVPTSISNTGFVIYRGLDSSSTIHYGILKTSIPAISFVYGALTLKSTTTPIVNSTNKILYNWINKSANGFTSNTNNGYANDTLNISLTDRLNTFIGCRSNAIDGSATTTYYQGYIKTIIILNTNANYNFISIV